MFCLLLYHVMLDFRHVMQCIYVGILIPVVFSLYDHREIDL